MHALWKIWGKSCDFETMQLTSAMRHSLEFVISWSVGVIQLKRAHSLLKIQYIIYIKFECSVITFKTVLSSFYAKFVAPVVERFYSLGIQKFLKKHFWSYQWRESVKKPTEENRCLAEFLALYPLCTYTHIRDKFPSRLVVPPPPIFRRTCVSRISMNIMTFPIECDLLWSYFSVGRSLFFFNQTHTRI